MNIQLFTSSRKSRLSLVALWGFFYTIKCFLNLVLIRRSYNRPACLDKLSISFNLFILMNTMICGHLPEYENKMKQLYNILISVLQWVQKWCTRTLNENFQKYISSRLNTCFLIPYGFFFYYSCKCLDLRFKYNNNCNQFYIFFSKQTNCLKIIWQ